MINNILMKTQIYQINYNKNNKCLNQLKTWWKTKLKAEIIRTLELSIIKNCLIKMTIYKVHFKI